MTPTLSGRLQTRLFLTIVIGVPVALIFKMVTVLLLMLLLGVVWDFLYARLQYSRWDGDWPAILIFITGVTEGLVLKYIGTSVLYIKADSFWLMYGVIFTLMFILQLGVLNIVFPARR